MNMTSLLVRALVLAIFATARTVSRVALQMVQLVNQTFWPELGAAFGELTLALSATCIATR